ncbi:spore coat protein, partial [Bacillus sp. B-TM1]
SYYKPAAPANPMIVQQLKSQLSMEQ